MANLQSAAEIVSSLVEENASLRRTLGDLFSQTRKEQGKTRQRLQQVLDQEEKKASRFGYPPWGLSPQEEANQRSSDRIALTVKDYLIETQDTEDPFEPDPSPEPSFMYSFLLRFFAEVGDTVQRIYKNTTFLIKSMSALTERLSQVLAYLQNEKAELLAELAEAKAELADALADDAADDAAVQAAEAAAELAAQTATEFLAKNAELQALVDADIAEDEAIKALLDSVQIPAPDAPAEPEVAPTEPEATV